MKTPSLILASALLLGGCVSKPALTVENLSQAQRDFYQGDRVAILVTNVGFDFSKVDLRVAKVPEHHHPDGSIHLAPGRIPPPKAEGSGQPQDWFRVPLAGLDPGDYVLELWVAGKREDTVNFSVRPRH